MRSPPTCRLSWRRCPGDDLPVIDDRDVVGEPIGLLEVLGRQQQRRAARDQLLDQRPHLEATAGIEPGRRFVEEEDGRRGIRLAARSSRRRMPPE